MTETTPKPRLNRRPWRRLMFAIVVVAALVSVSSWRSDVNLRNRAAQIRIGQSKEDVQSVLGSPHLTSFRGASGSYCYGREQRMIWAAKVLIYKHFGIGSVPTIDRFPVEVQFGDDGCVRNVRMRD